MLTQMFVSKLATSRHLLLSMFKKKPFHCVFQSLNEDRLLGNIKNVAITDKKEQFVGKKFKATEMVEAVRIYKTNEVVYDVGPVFQRFKATKTVEAVQIYKTKEVVYDVRPVFQRFKAMKTVEAVQIYKTKEVVYDVGPVSEV
ncbi:uncharacterized protein LOC144068700 isoform X2 [Stigmatopora argus]